MKKAFDIWKWSLRVVAGNPLAVLALGSLLALWGLAAYQWLGLPESSVFVLLIGVLWAIAQVLVAIGFLAVSAAGSVAAVTEATPPNGLRFLKLRWRHLTRTFLMSVGMAVVAWFAKEIFGWVNDHALEVASFLTFRSQEPVSYQVVGKIFWTLEALLWIGLAGTSLSLLLILLHSDWQETWRRSGRVFRNCCFRLPFLTGLISVAVFGGLAYLLVAWHPKVTPGFWDYLQMLLRLGAALLLIVVGGLFWLVALARLSLPSSENSSS